MLFSGYELNHPDDPRKCVFLNSRLQHPLLHFLTTRIWRQQNAYPSRPPPDAHNTPPGEADFCSPPDRRAYTNAFQGIPSAQSPPALFADSVRGRPLQTDAYANAFQGVAVCTISSCTFCIFSPPVLFYQLFEATSPTRAKASTPSFHMARPQRLPENVAFAFFAKCSVSMNWSFVTPPLR